MAKKGPGNTASNRVNCAAYAFISLSRDNLLIVSTKRDKPPCVPVSRPVFRWLATLDTLAAAPDATLRPAKRINLYAGERFDTRFLFLPPLSLSFSLSISLFRRIVEESRSNVCMTMGGGLVKESNGHSRNARSMRKSRHRNDDIRRNVL